MISRLLLVICALSLNVFGQTGATTAQDAQSTTTQTTHTATQRTTSGHESLTGCVAHEGDSFVLKTDDGGTYEFNTARDLSPYVGKKVNIAGRWTATGVTINAPVKKDTSETAPAAADKSAPPQKFVGDLHLRITGVVIGDCAAAK